MSMKKTFEMMIEFVPAYLCRCFLVVIPGGNLLLFLPLLLPLRFCRRRR